MTKLGQELIASLNEALVMELQTRVTELEAEIKNWRVRADIAQEENTEQSERVNQQTQLITKLEGRLEWVIQHLESGCDQEGALEEANGGLAEIAESRQDCPVKGNHWVHCPACTATQDDNPFRSTPAYEKCPSCGWPLTVGHSSSCEDRPGNAPKQTSNDTRETK